jgi:catechol 2,3-dioxygenase-like lactoylglutathione lyase family enzyme
MSAALHHLSIFVSDMERAISPFWDIFGFKLAWHVEKAKCHTLSSLLGIDEMVAELSYLIGSNGVAIEVALLVNHRS